jgi:hypothetical protein
MPHPPFLGIISYRLCSTFFGKAGDFLSFSSGPRVVDASFTSLEEPAASDAPTADANGCAAKFPAATGYVRLIFGAGVREKDASGALVNLGTEATVARANAFFSIRHPRSAEILGIADVDPDNFVDICVSGVDSTVVLRVRAQLLAPCRATDCCKIMR